MSMKEHNPDCDDNGLPNPSYNNTQCGVYDDGDQKVSRTRKARSDYILDCEGMFYQTYQLDHDD